MNQPDLFDLASTHSEAPRAMGARQPKDKARVLLRCPVKNCKFCKAVDISQTIQAGTYGSFAVLDKVQFARFRTDTKCTSHPTAYLESAIVEGTYSAARACDARCMSARGPECVCSCGGANHGCGWL